MTFPANMVGACNQKPLHPFLALTLTSHCGSTRAISMRVTAKSEYATRAVLHLAMEYPEVVTIHQIADRHRIPVKYLEQILLELKRGGSSSASAVSMAAIFF